MRAIVYHRNGPADVLELGELPRPTPGPEEILIKVHAAGVNPHDWKSRSSAILRRMNRASFPIIPGIDVAGEVVEVGPGVTRFRPGDAVFSMLRLNAEGGYAEYAVAPEAYAAKKPANLSHAEAASIPSVAQTALQLLRAAGALAAGKRVLVNGASGGVGSIGLQIVKAFGGEVTGVCSGKNVDLVRSLGADRVIDYTREDVTAQGPYDVVFDTVGTLSLFKSRKILTERGVHTSSAPVPSTFLAMAVSRVLRQKGQGGLVKPSGHDLAQIGALLEEGKIKPVIDRVMPLAEAAEAHRYGETGRIRGKVVLEPWR